MAAAACGNDDAATSEEPVDSSAAATEPAAATTGPTAVDEGPATGAEEPAATTEPAAVDEEPAVSTEGLRIAYLSGSSANTWYASSREQMQGIADDNGIEMVEFDAAFNPALQTAQLQDVIASGDYNGVIVAAVNGPGLIPDLEDALAQGIQVVVLNAGVHRPDRGTILLNGEPVMFRSPRDALAQGITIVAQELSLVPARSVRDNVFLGDEPTRGGIVRTREQRRRFESIVERVGFDVPLDALVMDLSVAEQQKVEILRALGRSADLIIMAEPTARLSTDEAEALLSIVARLSREGTTVVLVSHFLDQVLEVADIVSVMRDGSPVWWARGIQRSSEPSTGRTGVPRAGSPCAEGRSGAARPATPSAPAWA